MTKQRSAEYDAFGPWIFPISKQHPLPPLFARYRSVLEPALLVFKIPRNIERRRANPDMHLYDAVIGVFAGHLLILERKGDDVTEQKVLLSDVQAIQKSTNMLRGELYLYTKRSTYKTEYNTVSDVVITKAVALIRSLQTPRCITLGSPSLAYNTDNIGYLYFNLIRDLHDEDETVRLIAYQPKLSVTGKLGLWQRFKNLFTKKLTLQCTVYLTNARELIVIRRSEPVKVKRRADYAYSYTFVPLENIRDAQTNPHPKLPLLRTFTYRTADHAFSSVYDDSNIGIDALRDGLRSP